MDYKENRSKEGAKGVVKPNPASTISGSYELESIIKAQGYQNGKLFYGNDSATYTFLSDTDVVSLHFDLTRQLLFLKGHKINSCEDHPELMDYLARFKKALLGQSATRKFLTAFDTTVMRLNKL